MGGVKPRELIRRHCRIQQESKIAGKPAPGQSSGTRLIYCPVCKAPVVDSAYGRSVHFRNSPRCESAAAPNP
jgi:hypothetical protein